MLGGAGAGALSGGSITQRGVLGCYATGGFHLDGEAAAPERIADNTHSAADAVPARKSLQ